MGDPAENSETPAPEQVPEILIWFNTDHYVDQDLIPIANAYRDLAHAIFNTYGLNEQLYFSLQNLLVSKDAAVRGVKVAISAAQEVSKLDTTTGRAKLWTPDSE